MAVRTGKSGKFRDASLVLIVAEGHTEESYFGLFEALNSRIRIVFAPRLEGPTDPSHMIGQFKKAKKKYDISGKDTVWFVCDKDKWKTKHLSQLNADVKKIRNARLLMSNPCFEVWLLMHFVSPERDGQSCTQLKTDLGKLKPNNFKPESYLDHVGTAISLARASDTSANEIYPDPMQTRVYLLAEKLVEKMKQP